MSENKPTTRPVLQAIAKIMGEVGAVEKRGENKFHGYAYATAADIAHALQKRMSAEGLVIVPNQREMHMLDNGNAMAIEFEFMVMHTSGDVLEERPRFMGMASCKNSKGGFDDKAANKCLTAASKYFSLNLFRIPTGDYHDADGAEDVAPQRPAAPQSPPDRRQPPKAPRAAQPQPPAATARPGPSQAPQRAPLNDDVGDPIPVAGANGQPEPVVEYVNSKGAIESLPAGVAIKKIEAAHQSKIGDDAFDGLLNANREWLAEHYEAALWVFDNEPRAHVNA
jgi:hypothetical protein